MAVLETLSGPEGVGGATRREGSDGVGVPASKVGSEFDVVILGGATGEIGCDRRRPLCAKAMTLGSGKASLSLVTGLWLLVSLLSVESSLFVVLNSFGFGFLLVFGASFGVEIEVVSTVLTGVGAATVAGAGLSSCEVDRGAATA